MTIKDLKQQIENLPDDMIVMAYTGGNGDLHPVSSWIEDPKIEDIPAFVINVWE